MGRYLCLIAGEVAAVVAVFYIMPSLSERFVSRFSSVATDRSSNWWQVVSGGIEVTQQHIFIEIGAANYRNDSRSLLAEIPNVGS